MNKIIAFLLLLTSTFAFADYEYVIQPRSYWFSTHYDIYSGEKYITTVEKDWFHLNTIWSLCDERGEYANGTARLLSLGSLLNSKREIDVYDYYQKPVGSIQGEFFTTAAGKFVFYDENQHPYAVAFLDQNKASVNIMDFHNQRVPIAIFRRTYVPGGDYFWNIKVVKEDVIDPQALYVFSAFIADACWPINTQGGGSFWDTLNLLILLDRLQDE